MNSVQQGHNMSYEVACAPSENSDQPTHPRRLNWVFARRLKTLWIPVYAESPVKIDHTARMRRLLWVYAVHICNFVGNAVSGSIRFDTLIRYRCTNAKKYNDLSRKYTKDHDYTRWLVALLRTNYVCLRWCHNYAQSNATLPTIVQLLNKL